MCLRSLGLGVKDEVITSSHTAVATVAGIEQAGCTPVFADIDPVTRCIAPASIDKRITRNTKAIMPVHIYGQPCDMDAIQRIASLHQLEVIEDCSQAHGAELNGQKVGTFGILAAFSCYPTKNLGGTGDGGVILSRSQENADKIKSLRQYGWNEGRESMIAGFNSRLDEMQAAILRVKLKHLAEDNQRRRMVAQAYNHAFQGLPLTIPFMGNDQLHAMHLYVVENVQRNDLFAHLRENGIGASLHYPLAVHQHAAYAGRIGGSEDLGFTERFYKQHLTLPMYPELAKNKVMKIIEVVCDWFSDRNQ